MSSLERTLASDVLVHHLPAAARLIDRDLLERHGRSARTIVKEGVLRVVVIALAEGGDLPEHHAAGHVTLQLLDGELSVFALGTEYALRPGDVVVLAPGVAHSARSEPGCAFLLTIVRSESSARRGEQSPGSDESRFAPPSSESSPPWWQNEGGE